jgi:aryl-alcohol dehydrogenase-like predicted oxidoreductase
MTPAPLGDTGLDVALLSLGTVKLGRDQGVKYPTPVKIPDDQAATELLQAAANLGINTLDTAPAYGMAEERLGKLIAGQRNDWVICTKVGEEFENGVSRYDFSPEHCRFSVER